MRQAMGYLDQAPDKDTRVELIKTLQTVTEGKVGPRLVSQSCMLPGLSLVLCLQQAALQYPGDVCLALLPHLPVCCKNT